LRASTQNSDVARSKKRNGSAPSTRGLVTVGHTALDLGIEKFNKNHKHNDKPDQCSPLVAELTNSNNKGGCLKLNSVFASISHVWLTAIDSG